MSINQNLDTPEETGMQEPELPEASITDLPAKLQEGISRAGWNELTPVQAKAIPYLFSHRDMMIQSRTGSGKTGAYLLPMMELLNPLESKTQALVLVPTRELAVQVEKEAKILFSSSGFRSIAIYGGVGYHDQFQAFESGVHLVVGTPGRILDHLMRKSFSLDNLKMLIFDEADRMLSMGFYPDMRRVPILSSTKTHQQLYVFGDISTTGDQAFSTIHAISRISQPEQRSYPCFGSGTCLLLRPRDG